MMENGLAALRTDDSPATMSSGMPEGMQEMAAMEVVNNDVEALNLDPKTESLLKLGEAKELVEAANKLLSPSSQEIIQQYQQEVPRGIAGVMAKLMGQGRPQGMPQGGPQGMPQGVAGALAQITAQNRGQGMPQPRPQGMPQGMPQPRPQGMPSQGIAGQPVSNMGMEMAAQGGIIQYAEGGPIDDVTNYINQYRRYQEQLAIASTPEEKQALTARWRTVQDSFDPSIVVEAHQQMSVEDQSGMAGGGVVSFKAGDKVSGINIAEFSKMMGDRAGISTSAGGAVDMGGLGPTEVDEAEELSEIEQLMLQSAKEDMARDINAEQNTAQTEYEKFMLTPEQTAGRTAAQANLQALRKERFSPGEMRKRKTDAGLRGMGRQGLGGFAAGLADEEEAIYAERVTTGEEEIANYTALIEQFRADGLGRIEARAKAREVVETAKTRGMSTAEALQTAVDARSTGVQQRRNALDVANVYGATADRNRQVSEFNTRLNIHKTRLQRDHPGMAMEIISSEALRLIDLEEDSDNLMSYAQRGYGDITDTQLKKAEAIAKLTSGVYYRQMSTDNQEAEIARITALFDAIINAINTVPEGSQSFMPGADGAGGGPPPTEEQLVQLRAANPGYTDEKLIESFRKI